MLRLLTQDPVVRQCYFHAISTPEYYECRFDPRVSAVSGAGDRISSVLAFDPYRTNKIGLPQTIFSFLRPVSTWRPKQDRGLTTSPRTVEKKYQDIRRQTIGAIRHSGGTHSLCETRYATPGYIHWERLHLYVSGCLNYNSNLINIFNICHYV